MGAIAKMVATVVTFPLQVFFFFLFSSLFSSLLSPFPSSPSHNTIINKTIIIKNRLPNLVSGLLGLSLRERLKKKDMSPLSLLILELSMSLPSFTRRFFFFFFLPSFFLFFLSFFSFFFHPFIHFFLFLSFPFLFFPFLSFPFLFSQDGFRGWFRGMEAKLWQTVLTAAFQFSVYEQIQMLVFWLLLRDKYQTQSTLAHK